MVAARRSIKLNRLRPIKDPSNAIPFSYEDSAIAFGLTGGVAEYF